MDTMNAMNIDIKSLRLKYGYTQKEFSELLHIPKHSIENWEQGVSKCPPYVLELIAYRLEH